MFGFWAGQGLTLRRNTCFRWFKYFWWWHSTNQNLKSWSSQKYELQSFAFQNVPIWKQPLANQLGGFESNFRCLKRFLRKVRRKLRSAFFLKLRFLKIRLLVTWLKCLLQYILEVCQEYLIFRVFTVMYILMDILNLTGARNSFVNKYLN